MHDPLIVAFEIRSPWPKHNAWKTEHAARTNIRWEASGAFWVLAGRGLYWPPLITVWHHEPGNRDALTVCGKRHQRRGGAWGFGRAWRLHVYHWRIQVHPLQHLRRRLLTRCAWCQGRSVKGDPINISHQWGGPRGHWWQGETGLFHSDCSSIENAHSTCICEHPAPERGSYGTCSRCTRFRPFGITPEELARARELSAIPHGKRAKAGA